MSLPKGQGKNNDCGPTCFRNAMSILFYDIKIDQANSLCRLKKDGTDSGDLAAGFNRYGFDIKERDFYDKDRAWSWLMRETKRGQLAILAVDGDTHWILVLRAGKRKVQVFDPDNYDPTLVSRAQLLKRWKYNDEDTGKVVYQGLSIVPFKNKAIRAVNLRQKLLATGDVE